jgi:hypothetical protein
MITMMMEAVSTSETLDNIYQTTRRYIKKDSHLHTRSLRTSNLTYFLPVLTVNLYSLCPPDVSTLSWQSTHSNRDGNAGI